MPEKWELVRLVSESFPVETEDGTVVQIVDVIQEGQGPKVLIDASGNQYVALEQKMGVVTAL